jgi:hypothetical protein
MLLSIVASLILWLPFAQTAAQEVHPPSCPPVVTFVAFDDPNIAGRATWGVPGVCSIQIDEDRQWDFVTFCKVVVHEYGHLHFNSADHAPNPHDIMYPLMTDKITVPQCDAQAQLLQQEQKPIEPVNPGVVSTTDPGRNLVSTGAGDDIIKVKKGKGLINCGPGYDVIYTTRKVKKRYRFLKCERFKFQ